jgi:hypothetical protein
MGRRAPVIDWSEVEYELMSRFVRTITAEVNIPGTTDWVTVSGWDCPFLHGRNPDKGVIRIFSGDEPDESIATVTENRINEMMRAGRCDEWIFGMGQWRCAHFGEARP